MHPGLPVEAEITCPLCSFVTANVRDMRRHYKTDHPGEECFSDTIKCSQCDAKFSNHANLKNHIRQKHNDAITNKTSANLTINHCAECNL